MAIPNMGNLPKFWRNSARESQHMNNMTHMDLEMDVSDSKHKCVQFKAPVNATFTIL